MPQLDESLDVSLKIDPKFFAMEDEDDDNFFSTLVGTSERMKYKNKTKPETEKEVLSALKKIEASTISSLCKDFSKPITVKRKKKDNDFFHRVSKQRRNNEGNKTRHKQLMCMFHLNGQCQKGISCRNKHISLEKEEFKPLCSNLTKDLSLLQRFINCRRSSKERNFIIDCKEICVNKNCPYSHTPALEPCIHEFNSPTGSSGCSRAAADCVFSHKRIDYEKKVAFQTKHPIAMQLSRKGYDELKKLKTEATPDRKKSIKQKLDDMFTIPDELL